MYIPNSHRYLQHNAPDNHTKNVAVGRVFKVRLKGRVSIVNYSFGLVNICIVEKITKFDNDIFLDFRAAGKSFAGSTVRLRTACP